MAAATPTERRAHALCATCYAAPPRSPPPDPPTPPRAYALAHTPRLSPSMYERPSPTAPTLKAFRTYDLDGTGPKDRLMSFITNDLPEGEYPPFVSETGIGRVYFTTPWSRLRESMAGELVDHPHTYELVDAQAEVRPYFDIDSGTMHTYDDYITYLGAVELLVRALRAAFLRYYKLNIVRVILLDASSLAKRKFSMHIHLVLEHGAMFSNYAHLKAFVTALIADIRACPSCGGAWLGGLHHSPIAGKPAPPIIDTSVYSHDRMMRMLSQSKATGAPRYLVLHTPPVSADATTRTIEHPSPVTPDVFRALFYDTLICYIPREEGARCERILIFSPQKTGRVRRGGGQKRSAPAADRDSFAIRLWTPTGMAKRRCVTDGDGHIKPSEEDPVAICIRGLCKHIAREHDGIQIASLEQRRSNTVKLTTADRYCLVEKRHHRSNNTFFRVVATETDAGPRYRYYFACYNAACRQRLYVSPMAWDVPHELAAPLSRIVVPDRAVIGMSL